MLLAKHPVAHRGDVRVVTAVDPTSRYSSSSGCGGQLLVANYVNVVVFSQQGARPQSNMLSGSDLVSSLCDDDSESRETSATSGLSCIPQGLTALQPVLWCCRLVIVSAFRVQRAT